MTLIPSWIFRVFKRSGKTTLEKLEDIENDILSLESMRTSSIDTEKRLNFRLVVYSLIVFGMGFIIMYYYYWPTTHTGKVILWTVVVIYPSIITALKWLFRIFFSRNVSRADERLKLLRDEKQRLLEEVMENETFNKAQMILKRFDPLMFARLTAQETESLQTPRIGMKYSGDMSSVVRSRRVLGADGDNLTPSRTPLHRYQRRESIESEPSVSHRTGTDFKPTEKPRLLRPVLPRDRSLVDKLLDVLVGDGPDKRYALICGECAAHNGMALQEEFEFLAFRCCYCSHFNPPRRTRQRAPVPSNIMATPGIRSASSIDVRLPTGTTSRNGAPVIDAVAKPAEQHSTSSSPLPDLDVFEPLSSSDIHSDETVTAGPSSQ